MDSVSSILLHTQSVRLNILQPFTWTSGIKSPIYCDNRRLISFPEHRDFIVQAFARHIQNIYPQVQVIAGTATAAIPWAAYVSAALNLPMLYIRPEAKAHGAGKQIEGAVEVCVGKNVIILEDLISTGGSSIKAAQVVERELLCKPLAVMAIFEYGFPAAMEAFAAAKIPMHTLCNLSKLLENKALEAQFSVSDIAHIWEFAKNPNAWG